MRTIRNKIKKTSKSLTVKSALKKHGSLPKKKHGNLPVRKNASVAQFLLKKTWLIVIILGIFLISFPTLENFIIKIKNSSEQSKIKEKNVILKTVKNNNPIKIDPKLLSTKEILEPPERILIPSLGINLSVVEARVVDGYWELSETTASHGVGSGNPGENGNIVIFAHAREGLFLPLKDIKKEDEIIILTKDRWFRYQVFDIKEIMPDNIEVISPTKTEQLTLYTCTGFLDSKRLLVLAKLIK